jgi:hypothetical protein
LDTLTVDDFREAKALANPPFGVSDVTAAVMHLSATIDPTVVVDKNGNVVDPSWKAADDGES